MNRNYGDHKVPEPFKDEDKYVGLTKRQICFVLPVIVLCGGIVIQAFKWKILPIGIILAVVIAIVTLFVMLADVPDDKYLFGSGLKMEVIIFRILKKKLPKNRVIYSKFYNNGYKEW